MTAIRRLAMGLFLLAFAIGCDSGLRQEETITVNYNPMDQVKSTLSNYAKGQPLASEVTSYDYMVNEVRKVDPAKADILKAGLDDLKSSPAGTASKAKTLLKKLGLE
ncbi:MAG TPA: hypothetical protein VGE52_05800 [Pirellulales bacterium]